MGPSHLNDELLSGWRNALNLDDDLHSGACWQRYKFARLGRLAPYLSTAAPTLIPRSLVSFSQPSCSKLLQISEDVADDVRCLWLGTCGKASPV